MLFNSDNKLFVHTVLQPLSKFESQTPYIIELSLSFASLILERNSSEQMKALFESLGIRDHVQAILYSELSS